jgi:hypothetical protein
MKSLLLFALFASALAAQNFTSVTASHIQDAGGNLLPSGQLCAQAWSGNAPIVFQAGGGGIVITTPTCTTVTNGAITGFQVANSNYTNPLNVTYVLTVTDNSTGNVVSSTKPTQITGSTWSYDAYIPTGVPLALITAGPPGPQGIQGPVGPMGAVTATGTGGAFTVPGLLTAALITGPWLPWHLPANSGVKCDGSTDDTAAINTDLALGGGHIYPSGSTCIVSGALNVPSNTTILGYGCTLKLASNISNLATTKLELFNLGASTDVSILGFNINGMKEFQSALPDTPSGTVSYADLFYLNGSARIHIHDIYATEYPGYFANLQNANYNDFDNVRCLQCGTMRENAITDTYGNNNYSDGIFMGGASGSSYNSVRHATFGHDQSVSPRSGSSTVIPNASSMRAGVTVDSGWWNSVDDITCYNLSRCIHFENDTDTEANYHNTVHNVKILPIGDVDHAIIVNVFGSTDHFGDNSFSDVHSQNCRRTVNGVANTCVVFNEWIGNTFDHYESQLKDSSFSGAVFVAGTNMLIDNVSGTEINGGSATPFYQSTINNYQGTFIWLPGANHGLTISNSTFNQGSANTSYVSAGGIALTNLSQVNRWLNNTFISSNTTANLLTVSAPSYLTGNTFEYSGGSTNTNSFIHLNGIVQVNGLNFPVVTQGNAFVSDTNSMSALYLADGGNYFAPEQSNIIVGTMVTGYVYNYSSATPVGAFGYAKASIVNSGTVSQGPTSDSNGNLIVPVQKSTTGQRYLCIDTGGQLHSSASACSGT